MPHLYVICGHGAGDPGASGYGYEEAERVRVLGQRIAELGGDNVTLADTSHNWYAETKQGGGYYTASIPSDWEIVELHMDSAGSSAKGAHVIIRGEASQYDYALAEFISGMFPGRSSSLVQRTNLLNPNAAYKRGFNYRLIENGFISNADDLTKFNENIDEIARGYLRVFGIEVEDDMQPADIWTYAWYNDKGENTAPGGNMYNCAVANYYLTEELLKRVSALEASQGADPDAVAEAVKKAVEDKLKEIRLTVE